VKGGSKTLISWIITLVYIILCLVMYKSQQVYNFFHETKIDIKKRVLEVDELVFSSCDIQDFFLMCT